ncbi:hypothetical protein HJFPF1_05784 [Paramyrothecium foliicola]|nr:hypothetical protein HJFPF1_05784 [Paramyrothecium foliicola]
MGRQQHRIRDTFRSPSYYRQPLPGRLIDVGERDLFGRHSLPKLVKTNRKKGVYLALSYCWGLHGHSARTTSKNIKEMKTGIPWQVLPRTIQDAIAFTRKLGFQYLWVDALCIIQPDNPGDVSADWQKEAKMIGSYYQRAFLTLSATGASDSSQGCFLSRPAMEYPVKDCELIYHGRSGELLTATFNPRPRGPGSVSNSPLLKRAWVAQERAFSNRIIHFGRDCLFWECATHHISEASYEDKQMDEAALSQGMRLGLGIWVQLTELTALHETWAKFVSRYSQMQLTYQWDRLIAISSLVRILQTTTRQSYIAGHWTKTLPLGLAWHCIGSDAPEKLSPDIAPSWSWASVRGAVQFVPNILRAVPLIRVDGFFPQRTDSLSYAAHDNRIRVYGRLRHFPSDLLINPSRKYVVTTSIVSMSEWAMVLFWDRKPDLKPNEDLLCLPIAILGNSCWELVLEETQCLEHSQVSHRRIGLLRSNHNNGDLEWGVWHMLWLE